MLFLSGSIAAFPGRSNWKKKSTMFIWLINLDMKEEVFHLLHFVRFLTSRWIWIFWSSFGYILFNISIYFYNSLKPHVVILMFDVKKSDIFAARPGPVSSCDFCSGWRAAHSPLDIFSTLSNYCSVQFTLFWKSIKNTNKIINQSINQSKDCVEQWHPKRSQQFINWVPDTQP